MIPVSTLMNTTRFHDALGTSPSIYSSSMGGLAQTISGFFPQMYVSIHAVGSRTMKEGTLYQLYIYIYMYIYLYIYT